MENEATAWERGQDLEESWRHYGKKLCRDPKKMLDFFNNDENARNTKVNSV